MPILSGRPPPVDEDRIAGNERGRRGPIYFHKIWRGCAANFANHTTWKRHQVDAQQAVFSYGEGDLHESLVKWRGWCCVIFVRSCRVERRVVPLRRTPSGEGQAVDEAIIII